MIRRWWRQKRSGSERPRIHRDGRDLAQAALPEAELPAFTYHAAARFLYQKRLLDAVSDIEGDVVECGIGRGTTLLFWSLLSSSASHRRVWAFDSFEGFPEPTSRDASARRTRAGEWGVSSIEDIQRTLLASGLSAEWIRANVTIVKGFFDEALDCYTGEAIAVLYIDADLYASYKTVLEKFYNKVPTGGVVAFDEYMGTWENYYFPGARQAVDEFLAEAGATLRRDREFGKYYLVK